LTERLTNEINGSASGTAITSIMSRINWSVRKSELEMSTDTMRKAAMRANHVHGPNCNHDHGSPHAHPESNNSDNVIGAVADDMLNDDDLFGAMDHGLDDDAVMNHGPLKQRQSDNSDDESLSSSDSCNDSGSDSGNGSDSNVSTSINDIASLVIGSAPTSEVAVAVAAVAATATADE